MSKTNWTNKCKKEETCLRFKIQTFINGKASM